MCGRTTERARLAAIVRERAWRHDGGDGEVKGLAVDEREREKISDALRAMALAADCVDREVAEPLREAASRVAGGGSIPGLIQWAYWRARVC